MAPGEVVRTHAEAPRSTLALTTLERGAIARKRNWMLEIAGWGREVFPSDELLGRVPDTKRRRAYMTGIPVAFTASDGSMVYQRRGSERWHVLVGRTPLTRRAPGSSDAAQRSPCTYATKAAALAAARREERAKAGAY